MRRGLTLALAALLAMGLLAGAALAAGHNGDGPPPHPHMLLQQVEIDPDMFDHGALTGFRRCVDLAANRPVPNHAHHNHIHTGRAGMALANAGHAVVPGAPLTPWADCAALADDLPIPLPSPD